MKKIILASALGMSLAVTGMASANDVVPNLDKGTKSLDINGSYDNNTALDYQFNLGVGVGYFFIDNLEVAAVGGWQSNSLSDTYELGATAEYNFSTGTPWVPFVTVGVLWAGTELDDDVYNDTGDIDSDAWLGRFGGGIKYFFRNDIALALNLKYDIASDDIYSDDDGNLDDYNWTVGLGLRFYFD